MTPICASLHSLTERGKNCWPQKSVMCHDNGELNSGLVKCRRQTDIQTEPGIRVEHKMLNCAESGRIGVNFVLGFLLV